MQTVNDIRKAFLDYFAANEHEVVPSSPLVPLNDPTLMFANAGMVQFKNVFTGLESRDYQRAVTSQKCVRAGGKHNDLENVGYTARHHTFFEMLGNFSFGDYFKERAIELAWKLVTKEYGLTEEKLLVTVHSSDEDAAALWRKIAGLSDAKIIRIPTSDNFWPWVTPVRVARVQKFYDHGDHIQVARRVHWTKTAIVSLRSGTSCLCNSSRLPWKSGSNSLNHLSTRVWG